MTTIAQPSSVTTLQFPSILGAGNLWCVYDVIMHTNPDPAAPPEIIYVDCCKLSQLFTLAKAQGNSEFARMTKGNVPGVIRLLKITDDQAEGNREAFRLIRQSNPRCNLHGYNMTGQKGRPLVCNNGQIYGNQSEAAKALGISQGAISRHLRGELKQVNGFRFEYATTTDLVGQSQGINQ
jgi:hypothetical protein